MNKNLVQTRLSDEDLAVLVTIEDRLAKAAIAVSLDAPSRAQVARTAMKIGLKSLLLTTTAKGKKS